MDVLSATRTRLRLRVTAAAESAVRSGHPWIYAQSVRETNRKGALGELAVVYDRKDQFLAIGLFDPQSPLRLRVLHAGKPQPIDSAWWEARLRACVERRAGLFDAHTTGYRCIHGESDGWPGLVLDRYADTFVLKLYTAAWLPRLVSLSAMVQRVFNPQRIVLRLSRNIQPLARAQFQVDDGQVVSGPSTDRPVEFLETHLRFAADVIRGQKTGFFLDQRENRRLVGSLSSGRHVLNAFSFSGGFSLYAARGGAKSVMDLDISSHALESARRNFELNRSEPAVACCHRKAAQADAFEWLKEARERRFDLVILDPPSLAKREAERSGAMQAYGKLAESGLRILRPQGLLVAASCSAHVSKEEFVEVVQQAAQSSDRRFELLQVTGHPPDHPATFREAQYLKCIYLRVE